MQSASSKLRATFTQGSLFRHLLIMSATSSLGFIALFTVDALSLLYISWLGDTHFTAGVNYATQISFLLISMNIGFTVAISALVSRTVGEGHRYRTREFATSILTHIILMALVVSVPLFIWRDAFLTQLGASDEVHAVASQFLAITVPANVMMAIGMACAGILRAIGDAKRAMHVTLLGGLIMVGLDPLLIFGFKMGVIGAAVSTAISRLLWMCIGLYGVVRVHDMLIWPRAKRVWQDLMPMLRIAVPSILTNMAAPFAIIYSMTVFSTFGKDILGAFAIIDRITPLAFCVLFAMPASLGPIIGQNYGAQLFDRVRAVFIQAILAATLYSVAMWFILWMLAPEIVSLFKAQGDTARFFIFFCTWGTPIWIFLGLLFTANATFNNLGYPMLSTFFNWGRATFGTIPLVTVGAYYGGAEGGLIGIIIGAALFGIAAMITALWISARLERKTQQVQAERPEGTLGAVEMA